MEMVKAKIVAAITLSLLACSCSRSFTWEKFVMDGHRTGVTAPTADNVSEALGSVGDSCYIAPNGRVFPKGSATYAVAADLIAVQPEMAHLKQVIAHSAKEMHTKRADGDLSNWFVDRLMDDTARSTGKRVDVAIVNSGGIRVDMPAGDVIMDDIVSMFPFRNHLCYVALEGRDLKAIFDFMASGKVQPVAGVKLVVDNGVIDTLLVGGKEIDPDRIYGVATIDFLLDGGDGLNIAKNAKELIITDKKVIDSMLPYVMEYEKEGRLIEGSSDGRVVIKGERRKKK